MARRTVTFRPRSGKAGDVPSPTAAVLALALSLGAAACKQDPPLATVSSVDLNRFQGQWYEVASLPRTTQTDCTGTRASYAVTSPTSLTLVHQCNVGSLSGPVRQVVANAVVQDTNAPAKLQVDFGGFYGDYWIIDLGQKYEYAVVGHPSRDYLWVLSRTPKLDAATLADITKRAQDNGFDTSKLQYTVQPETAADPSTGPDASAVTPPTYGCRNGVGTRSGAPRTLAGLLAAVGVAAFARRMRRRRDVAS
jgi:apolipoprotein D and lipocalin family protein